ncbi:MAG TPA: hypothetical protein VHF23_02455 [Gaiellaceae bacterium]|nr:hypothetical protein [Gaiellaceae bacterium]
MSAISPERVSEKPGILEWLAWRRYLTMTRASSAVEYPIVEAAAWAQLLEDLARAGSPLFPDPSVVSETAAARTPADLRG